MSLSLPVFSVGVAVIILGLPCVLFPRQLVRLIRPPGFSAEAKRRYTFWFGVVGVAVGSIVMLGTHP